jgi:hypothetical protein
VTGSAILPDKGRGDMTELFGYRSPGHPSLEICAATPATGVKLYARYRLSETMQNNNEVSVQQISFHINFGKREGRGVETMLQLIMMKLLCING